MCTDRLSKSCPFCIENGMVKVLAENSAAYLVQVVKNGKAAIGRYFIIPKEHIELLTLRPDNWTTWENDLLDDAFAHACGDHELLEKLGDRSLAEALNLSWNQGKWAGQRVRHIHLWVIFRYDSREVGFDGLLDLADDFEKELQAAAVLLNASVTAPAA